MASFDPHNVDLATASQRDVACYLATLDDDDSDDSHPAGRLGVRISAVFVILVASTATTLFPVVATRMNRLRLPPYLYLFFRFFGSGVIIATAFVHLLDPAYEEIGPASCVGLTGGWASFTWPPTIAMAAALTIFLFELLAGWYVEAHRSPGDTSAAGACGPDGLCGITCDLPCDRPCTEGVCEPLQTAEVGGGVYGGVGQDTKSRSVIAETPTPTNSSSVSLNQRPFREQIAAFLILEFGIVFHSVIIGLNLGVAPASQFATLYPVMVFHQSFEGLGIGARLSAIAFPAHLSRLPWFLAILYGITTPVSIAAGLGLRTSYDSGSFTANVVSGVIDSASAGILMYTGLVEMLARDFLFDNTLFRHAWRVIYMLVCLFLGVALMSILGKWA